MTTAVLLAAHGTIDSLDDLPAFLANVRRGHAAPPELVAELRRRYEAIGGRSPLHAIQERVARKLAARLGRRVVWGNRLWRPYVRDRVGELASEGVTRLVLVALAQHSSHVYAEDARGAADASGVTLVAAPNWGAHAKLCEAFASRIARTVAASPAPGRTLVVLTAHSLPQAVVDAGDPYEREVRVAAEGVAAALSARVRESRGGPAPRVVVAFQSQGMSSGPGGRPVRWLGPDLKATLDAAAAAGERHVVFAPVGFLADHVEVLYDLDIEARAMAGDRGLTYARVPSLNDADDFIEVLADVAAPHLAAPAHVDG